MWSSLLCGGQPLPSARFRVSLAGMQHKSGRYHSLNQHRPLLLCGYEFSYSVPSTFPSGETSISLILPFFVLPFSSMLSWPLNLSLYAA